MVAAAGCQPAADTIAGDALHLEEHLATAVVDGSKPSATAPPAVEWSFETTLSGWKMLPPWRPGLVPARVSRGADCLRIELTRSPVPSPGRRNHLAALSVDVPDLNREDWGYLLVRARVTGDTAPTLQAGYNLPREGVSGPWPFAHDGENIPLVADGQVRSYLIRADFSWQAVDMWRQLVLLVLSNGPATVDLLSVSLVPKEADFAREPWGVRSTARGNQHRRSVYLHTPGRATYRLRLPAQARLDAGLGVLRRDAAVTFRVEVRGRAGQETVLDTTTADTERWVQQSVDLSRWGEQEVTLSLDVTSDRPGTVALWGAPTVTGARAADRPNVIFYVIDGAAADFMGVYGYPRRSTPHLERIAAGGVVFERAYSNSSWSKTSVPSFMTSLHHSVLGGYLTDSDPLPANVTTFAEHMHRAGYSTGVFTSNPYAGTLSSLERGVDVLREEHVDPNSRSSEVLHEDFWRWRQAYAGQPYWVHFQSTDVHWPFKPLSPTAGLFVDPQLREDYGRWEQQVATAAGLPAAWWPAPGGRYTPEVFSRAGVSRTRFFDAYRGLYDEAMAHNDLQIGRLVERLKAAGEWERTIVVVGSDHGADALFGLVDPQPPRPWGAAFYSTLYRVPLIVSWPGRVPAGRRVSEPVSMIDVLPTVLELAGLPPARDIQGRSLVPLVTGRGTWPARPVILDEFYRNAKTGELSGDIAVIDDRWLAAMSVSTQPPASAPSAAAGQPPPPPLLLYEIWASPGARSLHAEQPEVADHYLRLLRDVWDQHLVRARDIRRGAPSPMRADQLETLRSLGYIR